MALSMDRGHGERNVVARFLPGRWRMILFQSRAFILTVGRTRGLLGYTTFPLPGLGGRGGGSSRLYVSVLSGCRLSWSSFVSVRQKLCPSTSTSFIGRNSNLTLTESCLYFYNTCGRMQEIA